MKRFPLGVLPLFLAFAVPFSVFETRRLSAQPLPGTALLDVEGDLAAQMVAGIDRFLLRKIDESIAQRDQYWQRGSLSERAAYDESVSANRARLAHIIGATDERVAFDAPQLLGTVRRSSLVGRGENYEIHAIRWPVLRGTEGGLVEGEGLLLRPTGRAPIADCIALGDADWTPEMLAGLEPGVPAEAQFARWLAVSGCRVVIPTLIDRSDTHSLVGDSRRTNQPHREYVYRMAYEMGRHLIGYEVDKVRAIVDWLARDRGEDQPGIGIIGYGEGGLLALYAAALDTRIDAACVSGYFDSRQDLWQEPIYRNVFGVLREFGDAELATLVAPRRLIVEACDFPAVDGPPPVRDGRSGAAPGRLITPSLQRVQDEVARARRLAGDNEGGWIATVGGDEGTAAPGSTAALSQLVSALAPDAMALPPASAESSLRARWDDFDTAARQKRQFHQLVAFTQDLMREAEYVRADYWSAADPSSVESWEQSTRAYRERFYEEVIGRFDQPFSDPHPRTRQVYDTAAFTGYEVVLDVFPDVYAYGLLLVPKGIPVGERRPVVVCQHGLEGRPQDVADPDVDNTAYNQYACRLAERGFITYAPQNPYIGQDAFRTLQRKANPLGKTLFSIIIPQHHVTVEWLASLPFVDDERIAFYGLSYGGKTAMRVPSALTKYCLSICSADFDEWIWKNVSSRAKYSYIGTGEYEMFEFNLGRTFNYAEMAGLIAPRPFMVERGHHDGVAPDEWVAYEYAKVRRLYAMLGIPQNTEIEFFDGPHSIHGVGTFDFLHRHLDWPEPDERAENAAGQ